MFTSKQDRNGTAEGGGEQNSAQPGPDAAGQIASVQVQAEGYAEAWKTAGETIWTGGPTAGGGNYTAGGNMWDWDSGIAVPEQPGEM